MTRDDVMKMEAGMELDALVAERVMGWKVYGQCAHEDGSREYPHGWLWHGRGLFIFDGTMNRQWEPSTTIAAAWEVVERLCPNDPTSTGPGFELGRGPGIILDGVVAKHEARFFHANGPYYDVRAVADTAPLAICRAALLATLAPADAGEGGVGRG